MSNQFQRQINREKEGKEKEMQEKIDKLMVRINTAIIEYKTTLYYFLRKTENGSLVPESKVVSAKKQEIENTKRWFLQKNLRVPETKGWLSKKNEFIREVRLAEEELNIQIMPVVYTGNTGIVPGFAFRDLTKPTISDTNDK